MYHSKMLDFKAHYIPELVCATEQVKWNYFPNRILAETLKDAEYRRQICPSDFSKNALCFFQSHFHFHFR